jgi:FixH
MSQATEITTRAGRFWAYVPLGLLLCMFVGLGSLAYVAIDDPSFSLEPDYYSKAVHWERNQAQLRENSALGFTLAVHAPLVVASGGRTSVELELKDRTGVAISGAELQVTAFPNAFATRVEQLTLVEVAPGIYRGELKHGMVGLWELRCDANVGGAHYSRTLRTDVVKRSAA